MCVCAFTLLGWLLCGVDAARRERLMDELENPAMLDGVADVVVVVDAVVVAPLDSLIGP